MPAIDPSASTVATSALQAIPFSELIGGPLDAAVNAQYKAAQTTWEFINQVGLYEDPDTHEKKAVQVVFQYQKGGEMVNLVVPLITIVPIPYLVVDEVIIDFLANISAASSTYNEVTESENIGAELSGGTKFGWGPFSVHVDFKANYSSKRDSKATQQSQYSVEYTMNVHVKASGGGQMPGGLASVLNILNSSIEEAKPGGSLETDRTILRLTGDTPEILEVVIKDGKGLLVSGQEVTFAKVPNVGSGDFKFSSAPGLRYAIVSLGAGEDSKTVETDSNGVAKVQVQGVRNGLAALEVTSNLGNKRLEGRISVTVGGTASLPVITLEPASVEVDVNGTSDVIATVTDKQITELSASSDHTDLFTVSEDPIQVVDGKATITVTGVAEGEGELTVSGGGHEAAAHVTVKPA